MPNEKTTPIHPTVCYNGIVEVGNLELDLKKVMEPNPVVIVAELGESR